MGRLAYGYIDLVDLLFDRFVPRWTTLILIIIGTFVGVRYAGDPGIPAWAAAGFGGAAGAFAIPVLRLAVKLLPLAVIGGGISLLLR